jgi:hypothetical protein
LTGREKVKKRSRKGQASKVVCPVWRKGESGFAGDENLGEVVRE